MPYTTVDVEIDLDDFTTEDLVEELERRNAYRQELPGELIEQLAHIHHARLCGQPWEEELDRFLRDTLGKAI